MRVALLALALFLTGCATQGVPIKRNFPEAPEVLMKKCSNLQTTPAETSKLSAIIAIITNNYGTFHECQIQVEGWQEWYKVQKQTYEEGN